jgi:hypothetical protein
MQFSTIGNHYYNFINNVAVVDAIFNFRRISTGYIVCYTLLNSIDLQLLKNNKLEYRVSLKLHQKNFDFKTTSP